MRPRLLLALPLALTGCCRDPWSAFPMSSPPDQVCQVGGSVAGWDVYRWTCVGGEHVVVAQYSAEMTCQAPIREAVPCGSTTNFEREHGLVAGGKSDVCKEGSRPGREWRTR
jgi:hypothetical protein